MVVRRVHTIKIPNTQDSFVGGVMSHMPSYGDYSEIFTSRPDIVANNAGRAARQISRFSAPQGHHYPGDRPMYIERWRERIRDRDVRAHREIALAREKIAFARSESLAYEQSILGRTDDIDHRFRYNLARLVNNAVDALAALKRRHAEQEQVDFNRFFEGSYESPPILSYAYQEHPDQLDGDVWDAPPGPRDTNSTDV